MAVIHIPDEPRYPTGEQYCIRCGTSVSTVLGGYWEPFEPILLDGYFAVAMQHLHPDRDASNERECSKVRMGLVASLRRWWLLR